MLQPKTIYLRLNLEQANHTIDGWVENRDNIVEEHLPLYDSQCRDIIDQLAGQGVHIEFEEVETEESDDFQQAMDVMKDMVNFIQDASMDPMERGMLFGKLNKLNTVLFGKDINEEN